MKNIPVKHQMKCNTCGQIMDMRDLSQVFTHEECNGMPIDYEKMYKVEYSGSQKIGSPTFYTKDKKSIDLN